jgi:hypothetical protein
MNVVHDREDVMSMIRIDRAVRRFPVSGAAATHGRVVFFPTHRVVARRPAMRALQLTGPEAWRIGLGALAMVICGWITVKLVVSSVAAAVVTIDASGSLSCALFRMGCLP